MKVWDVKGENKNSSRDTETTKNQRKMQVFSFRNNTASIASESGTQAHGVFFAGTAHLSGKNRKGVVALSTTAVVCCGCQLCPMQSP